MVSEAPAPSTARFPALPRVTGPLNAEAPAVTVSAPPASTNASSHWMLRTLAWPVEKVIVGAPATLIRTSLVVVGTNPPLQFAGLCHDPSPLAPVQDSGSARTLVEAAER